MQAFPFTDAEWDLLKPIADSVLNASLAGDDVLAASFRLEMLELLDRLRERYGDHPVLLETAADYTEDDAEGAAIYRRAAEIADSNGLPTLSIRVALAYNLMVLGEPVAALEELRACGAEAVGGTAEERAEWAGMLTWAADYARDDMERVSLYRLAVVITSVYGVPTLGVRLPLARVLLDIGESTAALAELNACKGELAGGDDWDRATWMEHFTAAKPAEPSAADLARRFGSGSP